MKAFFRFFALISVLVALTTTTFAQEADDPELIFKKTTVWRLLSPDAKLATYVIDDPAVEGVACYFTVPEIGGWSGWAGFAEERSETSLACRQVGPVTLKAKFTQGEEIYRQRLPNIGSGFSASPVAADGKIYISSEDGEITVVAAGKQFRKIAGNDMGELLLATPALSEAVMYVRSAKSVIAIGRR